MLERLTYKTGQGPSLTGQRMLRTYHGSSPKTKGPLVHILAYLFPPWQLPPFLAKGPGGPAPGAR
jgi:hypothetical protein